MKLQYLAIIFVIIILPISFVLSEYMQSQIDTIVLQTGYDSKLNSATYDAMKAFQLNTTNNRYSTISDSKIRDIEASIQTFYNTLGISMSTNGYDIDTLRAYIPAMAFTLYDGYYIYSNHYDTQKNEYVYGLKPFIYYSCRYKDGAGGYDFVVNYTLDNFITIHGKVGVNYVSKSGYLINPDKVVENSDGTVNYDGVRIEPEILSEKLITLDSNNVPIQGRYQYITYNSQRVYKDGSKYFYFDGSKKNYINDLTMLADIKSHVVGGNLQSTSAIEYYKKAKEFSIWVNSNLGSVSTSWAKDAEGNQVEFSTQIEEKIFKTNNTTNDPLKDDSGFNTHRMEVIRKTIETNLVTSIANYNVHSAKNYEFVLPILQEEEWYKVQNNICMLTFMQGLPIGNKYYNNYSVISNNTNKETVGKNSIFLITSDGEHHEPGCKKLIEKNLTITGAYINSDYRRQTVKVTGEDITANSQLNGTAEDDNRFAYFYPQESPGCYDCIINISGEYSIEDIISGKLKVYKESGQVERELTTDISKVRKAYLTALARERYDLYKNVTVFE